MAPGRAGATEELALHPLVGRRTEAATIAAALHAGSAGRGSLVMLMGPPGIGKTRLAIAAEELGRGLGYTSARGRAWDGGGAPAYWPWIQVLRALGVEWSPEAPGEDAAESARFRLFDSVTRLLSDQAQRAPLLLLLDDLHGMDRSSLLLLRFLAEGLSGLALVIVGTLRDLESRGSPDIGRLLRIATRLDVPELGQDDVAELVTRAAGGPPPAELPAEVERLSSGNPLLVIELGRRLRESRRTRGPLEWVEIGVPLEMDEAIRGRLAPLSAGTRRTLEMAAVFGGEAPLAGIAAALDVARGRAQRDARGRVRGSGGGGFVRTVAIHARSGRRDGLRIDRTGGGPEAPRTRCSCARDDARRRRVLDRG